jgi:signal recognition particle GTPase
VFANDPYWSIVVDHWKVVRDRSADGPGGPLAFERQRLKAILASGNENTFLRQASRPLNRPTITFVAGANGSGKTSFDPLEL